MSFDYCLETRQRTVHHRVNVLGIEALAQLSGTYDIEKQDGGLPKRLSRRFDGGRSRQGREFGTQGGERRVHERISEGGPLGFEPVDGSFESVPLRGHDGRGF
jgi:hypothetical protein